MCLEILKTEKPDIIILDILMEPMDGWETLMHIRGNPATRHIPVIMFSAKKISPFEAETHHLYIDEYITKPVSPRNLMNTIANVLFRKEAGQTTFELWKTAGLPTEDLEEYARLLTSIEVDRGLCSNMQQQLESERGDGTLGDIQRTIGLIGSRIRENTRRAEEIALKGDSLVAAGRESGIIHDPVISEPEGGEQRERVRLRLSGNLHADASSPAAPVLPDTPRAPSVAPDSGVPPPAASQPAEPDTLPQVPGCAGTATAEPVHQDPEWDVGKAESASPIAGSGPGTPAPDQDTTPSAEMPAATISESLFEDEEKPADPEHFPALSRPASANRDKSEPGDDTGGQHQSRAREAPAPREPEQLFQGPGPGQVRRSQKAAGAPETSKSPRAGATPAHSTVPKTAKNAQMDKTSPSPGIFARIIAAIMRLFFRSKR